MTRPEFEIPDEIDPRSPLFFLSYAHSAEIRQHRGNRHERNWRFAKFFDDLSENVAELVSRPAGSDPGYMDRSIPDGERWTPELLTAIGTCQVFVALLSPPYFESRWCGLEWHAFSQRRVTSRSPGRASSQTAIVPVIWAPIREQDVPAAVGQIQMFYPRGAPNADLAAQYESNGIVGLLQVSDVAYQTVVWLLALRIADLHYNHRVEHGTFKIDDLRNVFEEQPV
jgi:TIR domain